jgi:hypothetical protein
MRGFALSIISKQCSSPELPIGKLPLGIHDLRTGNRPLRRLFRSRAIRLAVIAVGLSRVKHVCLLCAGLERPPYLDIGQSERDSVRQIFHCDFMMP